MWSLFPELLGPMILAFVAGSVVAWAVVGLFIPRRPTPAPAPPPPPGSRGS
jgi:hypothetical protein